MLKVSATQLKKRFGRYGKVAIHGPVVMTFLGSDSLVLISAEEYRHLRSCEERVAVPVTPARTASA